MKKRTLTFAKDIISFCISLPKNQEVGLIKNQLFRSGTSVGANYRAACRARSKKEFIAKLGIVEEEADETLYWLELLKVLIPKIAEKIQTLEKECDELLSIVISSIKTARKNLSKSNP
ncbi:MAG: four helix bundle protein [Candidatus Marinimicrobia bacterium]|nr:four helix bundle protein [Candidatus Neomarinimicrobiota bacterium]